MKDKLLEIAIKEIINWNNSMINFSSAILILSVNLLTNTLKTSKLFYLYLLFGSWLCYLLSIIFGLFCRQMIIGQLINKDETSIKDLLKQTFLNNCCSNVNLMALLQTLMFVIGTFLFIIFSFKVILSRYRKGTKYSISKNKNT